MEDHDPIEEFFDFEKESSQVKSEKDLELWNEWIQSGKDPNTLRPLLNQFNGAIGRQVYKYRSNINIPQSALKAEFTNQAIKAFDTYDPNKGASLHTHVTWQMLKGRRFVTTYTNIGRIPESRAYKVGEFQTAQSILQDQLGREPSAMEMADQLKWPVKQVSTMQTEIRRQVPSSVLQSDMMSIMPSRTDEVLRLIQYELNPEENLMLEYLYGLNGKPQLKPGQIATKMNVPASKVSRMKASIASKIKGYI